MRSTKGLTIVEVLLATAIIGIAVGILSYSVNAFRMNSRAAGESGGLNLARSYVDTVRGFWQNGLFYTNANLPDISIPPKYSLNIIVNEKYKASSVAASGTWTITCNNPSSSANILLSSCGSLTAGTNMLTDGTSRTRELVVAAVDTARNAGGSPVSTWITAPQ